MSVILLLIPLSLVMAGLFLGAFVWAVRRGQYEDTCTPSMRILVDDDGGAAREISRMNKGQADEN
ncbi:MAG: cbb3-type cytochrome oxidase assembly protein CcoS [Verrucomicrobiota bacterium]|jgi:cbb3-type cytochrome oxidase maturation protein